MEEERISDVERCENGEVGCWIDFCCSGVDRLMQREMEVPALEPIGRVSEMFQLVSISAQNLFQKLNFDPQSVFQLHHNLISDSKTSTTSIQS